MTLKKVVLFSLSKIKVNALRNAVLQEFGPVCAVETLQPGETGCPQPISEKSAVQCIERRIAPHKNLIEESDDSVLFVAIENYLEKASFGYYYDKVSVILISQGGNWVRKSQSTQSPSVRAPDAYTPHLDTSTEMLGEIWGCKITLGEMMHKDNPLCPSDDWFSFSPYCSSSLSRHTQIFDVLKQHFQKYADLQELKEKKIEFYNDFPTDGVRFADMLPLMGDPSCDLPFLMSQTIKSCLTTTDYVLVGLESRGLLLASMLSTHNDIQFIACRKKGKLPRDADNPVQTISYQTEYSSDTLEIQRRHITPGMVHNEHSFILVDDVLATGGSLCAAANLLAQLDIRTSMVLVLCDVPALRSVWKKAFAENKNLANVPVRFVL